MPFSATLQHGRARRFWWPLVIGAAVVIGLIGWLVASWSGSSGTPRIIANNISRNFRACLITAQNGAGAAADVWAGIQDAAHKAPINAQRLTVPNATPVTPYVNSLVARKCGLIVSVGASLHSAVAAAAQRNPRQKFMSVGQSIALPNVHNLANADRAAISAVVRRAAAQH